jgi:hypothetical protein
MGTRTEFEKAGLEGNDAKADDPQITFYGLLDQMRKTASKAVDLDLGECQMSTPQVKMMRTLSWR